MAVKEEMAENDRDLKMARQIADQVALLGGRTYFVGGLVRDRLLGRENKDIDIEVHGITPRQLWDLLSGLGNVTSMGLSFGVLGLSHYDIDIAMPRKEHATGRGHKDFDVFVDPFLGPEKAALRRDFTMNALMEDVLTGEILDFFGGRRDMEQGVIRHVNDITFAEDPLRVLRGAQFAARFGYRVADETVELSRRMDLKALPKERIFGELEKALRKAPQPSVFFRELQRMDQMKDWFGELAALEDVPQDPEHHPEKDVYTHTMMVLDEAAKLREEAQNPEALMLSALAHDMGKALVTEVGKDGRIHAYRHENAGVPVAGRWIRRLNSEKRLNAYVENMTLMHMRPNQAFREHSSVKVTNRMLDQSICPEDLLLLAKADHLGRLNPAPYEEAEAFLQSRLRTYRETMAQPFVQGRDLVLAGYRPGKDFKTALELAHKLRLAGVEKEEALRQTIAELKQIRQAGHLEDGTEDASLSSPDPKTGQKTEEKTEQETEQ